MNLANKISLMRVFLAPCVAASLLYYTPERDWLRYLCLSLFVLGMISDAVDGFIARSKQQQTQLGSWLDPFADKLLILTALISLSTIRALPDWLRIPAWFNLIVISRDVILLVGTGLVFSLTGQSAVSPSRLGKWAIAAQMAVVPIVLLRLPFKTAILLGAACLTVLSGIAYVRLGVRLLSGVSTSRPPQGGSQRTQEVRPEGQGVDTLSRQGGAKGSP